MGNKFCAEKITNPKVVSNDKSMVKAQGPKWHKKDRKKGIIPKNLRNVDTESEWGKSYYKGWIQGYALNLTCTATTNSVRIPTDADATTANVQEKNVFLPMIDNIPEQTKYILADAGYDDSNIIDKCEQRKNGKYITRRIVCPMEKGKSTSTKRLKYIRYFKSPFGQKLFKLRKTTIEPLFDIIKRTFDLEPCWMKGKANNTAILLLAVYVYQIMLYYNYLIEQPIAKVEWIINVI